MTALLHYAFLKGWRDRSLPTFFLIPAAQITAIVIGFSYVKDALHYPFTGFPLDRFDAPIFFVIAPSFIATLSAFWTFRAEIETRAISSFVMASRPASVAAALILFAGATAFAGILLSFAMLVLLVADYPAQFAPLLGLGAVAAMVGASLGALFVTFSPQPMMLMSGLIVTGIVTTLIYRSVSMPLAGSILVVACIAASTFFVRRRCAA